MWAEEGLWPESEQEVFLIGREVSYALEPSLLAAMPAQFARTGNPALLFQDVKALQAEWLGGCARRLSRPEQHMCQSMGGMIETERDVPTLFLLNVLIFLTNQKRISLSRCRSVLIQERIRINHGGWIWKSQSVHPETW